MSAIKPPYSTVCLAGRSFSQLIRHIYLGEAIEKSVDFMHPSSIELMCEAYLRSELAPPEIKLEYTLLSVGKTMPAVDIYGRSVNGKKIFAQVTFAEGQEHKVKNLISFINGTGISIYFSRDKNVFAAGLDYHFNIDDIFKQFLTADNSNWPKMINEMLGLANN